MLQLHGISKKFGNTQVLHDVSFIVQTGDICGFIGDNGAGKSTTMQVVATLLRDYTGDVFLGKKILRGNESLHQKNIGFMPDQYGLYNDLNIVEYLRFVGLSYGITNIHARTKKILEIVQLEQKMDTRIGDLSRGMTQRICLAKALLPDPDYLILDEPASGLDPKLRIMLRNLLLDLKKQEKTILVSSHILSELGDYCDTVVVIENGSIVEQRQLQSMPYQLIHIKTSDDKKLVRYIDKQDNIISYVSTPTGIRIQCDDIAIGNDIIRWALDNKCIINSYTTNKENIEDIYIDIVG